MLLEALATLAPMLKEKQGEMLGTAIGAGQLIAGAVKKGQANKMAAPLVDPQVEAALADIQKKRRQLEVGTSPEYKYISDQIQKGLGQTQSNIAKFAGGGGGATLAGLTAAQAGAGDQINKLGVLQGQQVGAYTQAANSIIEKMSQRKLDLQMWERLQKLRESAELSKSGMSNVMAGVASSVPTGMETEKYNTNPLGEMGNTALSGLMGGAGGLS